MSDRPGRDRFEGTDQFNIEQLEALLRDGSRSAGERLFGDLERTRQGSVADGRYLAQQIAKYEELEEVMAKVSSRMRDFSEDSEEFKNLGAYLSKLNSQYADIGESISNIYARHQDINSEEAEYATSVLRSANAIRDRVKSSRENLKNLQEEREVLLSNEDLGISELERRERLAEVDSEIRKNRQAIKDSTVNSKTGSEVLEGTKVGSAMSGFMRNIDTLSGGRFNTEDRLGKVVDRFASRIGDSFEGIATQITGAISALSKQLDDAINDAASFLDKNYTQINSNLKGFDLTFKEINDRSTSTIGLNRFVKQTDYLTEVAKLTQSGIAFNIEERAMLATVGEKILDTFSATDNTITRLTRYMGKDVTASQYGVEYTLRNTLNKVFGDHSFLNSLYDTVTSTIQDAALAVEGRDITPFNSSVSTWLGYMYEYGLSDEVVSKIAQGINYLGSGNVTALANSPDLQRLMLLSMDTAGLNYAEILQQGLDVDTTNILMKSIISYLDEIVNNTKDNLVLQNSYANLFNMSITDMKAIHNLANTDIDYLSSSSSAIAATYKSVADLSKDTIVATQIDNMMANAAYTYGSNIADNEGKYIAYKVSDVIVDVMEPWTQIKGAVGRVASAAQLIGSIGKFAVTALGLTSVAKNLFNGSLSAADTSIASNYISTNSLVMQKYNASTSNTTMTGTRSTAYSTSKRDDFLEGVNLQTSELVGDEKEWTTDDHDTLDILKEFERTIMISDAKQGYAIAVSLEGMNNDVLKSFASIFADEDAMLKTYEGKNSVIKDSLFNYVDGSDFGITRESIAGNTQATQGNNQ